MIDKTAVDAIALLAQGALTGQILELGGRQFIATHRDRVLQDIEDLTEKNLAAPRRIKHSETVLSLESFTRYVNEFKNAATKIYIDRDGNAKAMIDDIMPGNPSWRSHSINLALTKSSRWEIWAKLNKVSMTQTGFADFIEDNTRDFVAPTAGAMVDIARTFHAEQNSTFGSAVREQNGDVTFNYRRETTARAGTSSDMTIPSQFTIAVPILEGEEPRPLSVKLRYNLESGKLTLSYDIVNVRGILDDVRNSVRATITNETNLSPFLVPNV